MRCLLVALGLITSIGGAFAQEFELPTLRGSEGWMPAPPPAFTGWGGIYAGGQVSYSTAGSDFGNGVNDLASFIVRNTILQPVVSNLSTLPKADTNGASYGWFVGYNSQWEGVILGLEVNYNRTTLNVGASDTIPPLLIANNAGAPPGHHFIYSLHLTGSESIRITDVATFRARAGWAAGQFLPYAFLGVAVARADVSRSATVSWDRTDTLDPGTPPPPINGSFTQTQTDATQGHFYYGYAVGVGLEICVMPNVFVRGEWELDNFQSLRINMNSVRTGIGVKF
jgi:outer membrane immunogenic protein